MELISGCVNAQNVKIDRDLPSTQQHYDSMKCQIKIHSVFSKI